jgi:pyruvate kinase
LVKEDHSVNRSRTARRSKIICTLGPSSNSYEKIMALTRAGMDVARLNFSHGSHEEHRQVIETIRRVSHDCNKPIAIMQDLQGPKIRVQDFEHDQVELKTGSEFILTSRPLLGNEKIASVSFDTFHKDVRIGDPVLLDDGLLKLKVEKIDGTDVHCIVIFGGKLSNKKGLNLPGAILSINALTDKDINDLQFGLLMDVDYIALSFVQKPQDIIDIKNHIAAAKKDVPVIAKIEKPQAVQEIEKITDLADVIMVARGDLGVEVSAEEVPPIQKKIITLCNHKGVPVITATQMLDSMIHNPRPTRAEASDVANAILDGSDAVMLSGETASGCFPVEAVQTMHRIVELIEKEQNTRWDLRRRTHNGIYDPALAIGYSACHAADLVQAAAIVCLSQTGSTARMIARYRPDQPILAVTHSPKSLTRMALYWGVCGYQIAEFKSNMDHAIHDVFEILKKKGALKSKDMVVLTAGLPFSTRRGTNMLRIEKIPD